MSGTSPVTSQGDDFGISGAIKVTIKSSRGDAAGNKLDSSDLSLAHGSSRTYEDGLEDNSSGGGGIVTTVAVEFLADTPPATGDIASFDGVDCKCIDVEITHEAGELVKGTANYTSDYDAE
jgi:hypothetical protein